jgi:DNA-binding transcriptional MerR regulator
MKPYVPFFSIQQVSQKCDVSKSMLRFWEKKFKNLLSPVCSVGGQRRYSADSVTVIELIKALEEEGLSLGKIGERIKTRQVWSVIRHWRSPLNVLLTESPLWSR